MARIVFAWELGGGAGHLTRFAPIIAGLVARGHSVTMLARNLPDAQRLLRATGAQVRPAPRSRAGPEPAVFADSYADVLLGQGYGDPGVLGPMLLDWRRALAAAAPDLVVVDFSPTAMLAAQLDGIPLVAVEYGYTAPPRSRPLPFTRPWDDPPPPGRLAALDRAAAGGINAALRAVGAARRLEHAEQLFECAASFLCSFPELDHYETREPTDFYGPIYADADGVEPAWPGGGTRVFAYVNPGHGAFPTLLAALAGLGVSSVVHAGGLDEAAAAALSNAVVRVESRPVRVSAALAGCSLAVCQGIGTASAALVAGRPLLMLPAYLEQLMTVHRVAGQGLGLGLASDATLEEATAILRRLLDGQAFHDKAAGFAARYHGFAPLDVAEAIVADCERAALGLTAN